MDARFSRFSIGLGLLDLKNKQSKNQITMSQKSNMRRAKYAAEQEKKAKKVVKGIIWTLVGLTIAYMIWTFTQS